MMKKLWSNEKGFTLMEIVIVIVILGILALLAIPRLLGFTEQAEIANDKEYAAVVGKAAELYWASHDKDIVVPTGSTAYAVLLAAELYNAKENTLQYFDAGATVTVYVSTGTAATAADNVTDESDVDDDGNTTETFTVDKGVAIITISGNAGGSAAPNDIVYTSQYGYTSLP